MNTPRKLLAILGAVLTLIIAATVGAFAGSKLVEGNIPSVVVDIAQSVPVEITAPIELDDGEIVTVSAPITVNVELRVSIDGKGEAKVIEEAVQEPTITVTDVTVTEATGEEEISNLVWRVTGQENLGAEFSWEDYGYPPYTTSGMFISLEFEVENQGNVPLSLSPYGEDGIEAFLIDERERRFAEMDYNIAFDEICKNNRINPGITANCVMVFDVAQDVKSLTLRLSRNGETAEIPLTVQKSE